MDPDHSGSPIDDLTQDTPQLPPDQADFYQRLRHQIRAFASDRIGAGKFVVDYLLAGPDIFHLLCRLLLDRSVALGDKAVVAAAVAYYMTPFDALPELILGPMGFVDDIALAAYVLRRLLKSNPEAVRRHWAGERDIVVQIELLLDGVDKLIGVGRWNAILRYFDGRSAEPEATPGAPPPRTN